VKGAKEDFVSGRLVYKRTTRTFLVARGLYRRGAAREVPVLVYISLRLGSACEKAALCGASSSPV
jgi:hypothetical protein